MGSEGRAARSADALSTPRRSRSGQATVPACMPVGLQPPVSWQSEMHPTRVATPKPGMGSLGDRCWLWIDSPLIGHDQWLKIALPYALMENLPSSHGLTS